MSYSFVANMAVSVKEKQSIQLAYWANILADGVLTLVQHKQEVPSCLVIAATKYELFKWVK